MKLEVFSKETNDWKLVKESEDMSELESIVKLTKDTPKWRIISNNKVVGNFSIASPIEDSILELRGEYKGIDVIHNLENSPHLKNRGYFIQNSYTIYEKEGPILEIDNDERIREINPKKAQSHDIFFGCFDENDVIYLQIYPFPSNENISTLDYRINTGDTMTVLKDLNAFVNELKSKEV